MKMEPVENLNKHGIAMFVLAVMLGTAGLTASAGTKPAAPKAAPAAHPAAAPKPAGGGASHAATPSAAGHTTAGATTHAGPTANGSHTTTAGGAAGHTTAGAAGGAHTTAGAAGGAHTAAGGAAGAHGNTASAPHGTTASHSAISKPVPRGTSEHVTKSGSAIRTRSNGRVSDVHDAKRGMDIHHGLDGGRHVSVQRHDGSRLVADRGRRGYVERGYHYRGHDFARRSYYWHGHEYGRFYRGYGYRGLALNVYAPGFYFGAPFYGWAYNPWAAAISYGWGWGGSPWLGFYGGFFSPWAVYPSASYWLADYLIAENLQAAYDAAGAVSSASGPEPALINQQEGGPGPANEHNISTWTWNGSQYEMNFNGHCGNLTVERWDDQEVVLRRADFNGFKALYRGRFIAPGKLSGTVDWNPGGPPHMGTWSASFPPQEAPQAGSSLAGATPLSEDVKQQIAAEVKAQLALENQEATQTAANQDVDPGSSSIARLLADGHTHVFVVGTGLDLTDSNGAECAVSEGDALALRTPPPADATTADLVVLASKGGKECSSGGTVAVNLTDLQEMQNHLRETIDTGLKELQSKQGKGGLPAAPASAQAPPKESPYAEVAPPADPQDEKDIQAQAQQADSAESEVAQSAAQENGTPIAPTAPAAPAAPVATATVALGQTTDQVKAILGNPSKTADLGAKTIYYYDGMKVVFKAGKVTDVE